MKYLLLAVLVVLTGCSATSVASYKAAANERMAQQSSPRTRAYLSEEAKAELRKLWADNGEVLDLIDLEREIVPPQLVSVVPPVYPSRVRTSSAKVVVAAVIDEKGNVMTARIYQSSDSSYNASALQAISRWKFNPARIENRPIKMLALVPVEYRR